MQEGTKLVCRKTLILTNKGKGKAYGRQGKAPTGFTFQHSIVLVLERTA